MLFDEILKRSGSGLQSEGFPHDVCRLEDYCLLYAAITAERKEPSRLKKTLYKIIYVKPLDNLLVLRGVKLLSIRGGRVIFKLWYY